jgi:hypothetical protein
MHIAVYKGASQYDSLRTHADQIAGALVALGHEVTVIDLLDDHYVQRLEAVLRDANAPRLFVGFNGVAAELTVGDRSLYEAVEAHYVTFMVDHPIYQWGRLTAPSGRRIVPCFLDRSHVRYVAETAPPDTHPFLGFLPPGANTRDPAATPPPFRWGPERDIPVLFTGTYRGTPTRSWVGEGTVLAQLIDGTVERALAGEHVAAHEALRATLKDLGVEAPLRLEGALTPALHTALNYCASVRREQLVTQLCEAQVPVVVYGKGWEPLAERYPTLDYRGEGSWQETLSLLPRAKIVLNSNNEFVEGGHERVFAAQAHGAAVVSDSSAYYQQHYRDDEDICLYRWSEVGSLGERVRDLLASGPRLEAIAHAGYRATCEHHTWSRRAQDALRLWQLAMLDASS